MGSKRKEHKDFEERVKHYKALSKLYKNVGTVYESLSSIKGGDAKYNDIIKNISEDKLPKVVELFDENEDTDTPFYIFVREFYPDLERLMNIRNTLYREKVRDPYMYECEELKNSKKIYLREGGIFEELQRIWNQDLSDDIKEMFILIHEDEKRIEHLKNVMQNEQKQN